jgi:hypothetical protein
MAEHPTANLSGPVKEGFLVKQGGKYRTWKKRWFVLHNNHISYHKEKGKVSKFSSQRVICLKYLIFTLDRNLWDLFHSTW